MQPGERGADRLPGLRVPEAQRAVECSPETRRRPSGVTATLLTEPYAR